MWVWDILVLQDPGTLGPQDLGTFDIGEWDWRWTCDLYIDLKMLRGGWVEPWDLFLPFTFSSSNLLLPPSYSCHSFSSLALRILICTKLDFFFFSQSVWQNVGQRCVFEKLISVHSFESSSVYLFNLKKIYINLILLNFHEKDKFLSFHQF